MTIDKLDGYADGSGAVVQEPTPTEKGLGWKEGEQVTAGHDNWWNAEITGRINKIIEERINSYYSEAADPNKMITTGIWNENWGNTLGLYSQNNIQDSVTTDKEYKDLCVIFNSDSEPRVVVLDRAAAKAEVWDARARTLLDTSDAFTDDLPTGASQDWDIVSACTDGTNLYVLFADINPGSGSFTFQVQGWVIETWDVVSGWPTFGTTINGLGGTLDLPNADIIIADDSYLAVSCPWVTITAPSDASIVLVDRSTGGISGALSGSGDAPTGVSAEIACLCSDGFNIFFHTHGTALYYCSATIADPQVGCGGANWGTLNDSTNIKQSRIVSCGTMIVSFITPTAASATSVVLRSHAGISNAKADVILYGHNTRATPTVGNAYIIEKPNRLLYDGVNVWVLGNVVLSAGANEQTAICKIDCSKLSLDDTTVSRHLGDLNPSTFIVPSSDPNVTGDNQSDRNMVFDGRDIWVTDETILGNSNVVWRLPLALIRS